MRKLGEGWQYTTYDLGNGRVLKKYHSWLKAFWQIFKTIFPFQNDPPWNIPKFIRDMDRKTKESFRILNEYNVPPAWVGNPRFLESFDFEQDKVKPIHDVFREVDGERGKQIIDQFIEFNKACLDIGFIDKSFNITKNFGINSNGDIVLIDIGELYDDPVQVQHQLEIRVWEKDYNAGCIQDNELREYFITQMAKHFKTS